jgi:hypothetical protein
MYENFQNGKWKCNLIDPKQWFDIFAILFFFSVRLPASKSRELIQFPCVQVACDILLKSS